MTEKEIEAYFVKRVKALGGYAYKFRSITQVGVADRIACSGRLSALQQIFAEEMQHTKQHYACLWSKDDVDAWASRFS